MTERDDQKLNRLILAVADGYADCLDGIYAVAGGRMFAVAASVAGREFAEDVLHESFIKIARFAGKYRPDMNPYGWLMKIVRNTALDFLKARKLRREESAEAMFALASDYSPEKRDNALMLEQALAKLDPGERKIIYCVYYLDMTVREIAAELKMSKSAVQRAKDRAEKNLKSLLDGGTED